MLISDYIIVIKFLWKDFMRTSIKKRLQFFVVAIIVYVIGFQLIPENLLYDGSIQSLLPLILAVVGYFIFLPILHWLWVIKAGKQKAWKILLIFSLSSVCARYSFPKEIAQYFEFIMYLRYPIIAILLIIELYLMVTIVKGLWQARKLSGDPRIHTVKKYQHDDKKLALALPMSWEPASWYYAIPKFSKQHVKALGRLVTNSMARSHWFILIAACFFTGSLSYYLLEKWSEITALFISGLAFYSMVFITANYRVSRHYSIYIKDKKLIINNAFWGFMVVDVENIATITEGRWAKKENKEQLMLGKGNEANIEIVFKTEQTFLGTLGQFPENIDKVWLHVEQAKQLIDNVEQKMVINIGNNNG